MNIRKKWMKLILGASAFFWAGCSEDPFSANGPHNITSSDSQRLTSSSDGQVPVFPSSSSGEVSLSSSSYESSSASEPLVPLDSAAREAAKKRGEEMCATYGGLKYSYQYQPPWGTAESNGERSGQISVRDSVEQVLQSGAVGRLSKARRDCLRDFVSSIQMVAMYGSPLPEDSNPYDAWTYACGNGALIKDSEQQRLDKIYDDAYAVAKKESAERFRKELSDKCDNR